MTKERTIPALAERVAREYRHRLLQAAKAGGRLPSVRALAREIGVSVTTLRAAQALLAGQGLLEIRHGSGVYVVPPEQGRWVGIYSSMDILMPRSSPFFQTVPHALRRFFNRHGLDAEIYIGTTTVERREQEPGLRFQNDVRSGRISGIVITNAPVSPAWEAWMRGVDLPAVGDHTPYGVNAAYDEMIRNGVRHLHASGCRRIAGLFPVCEAWRIQFMNALGEAGLPFHPQWFRNRVYPLNPGSGWEEFRALWNASAEKPDGLLVADDVLFDEAQRAILELGIAVPGQLRIVTHANSGSRRYPFPVTEACYSHERHAEVLGGMLLKRMAGEAVEPVTLPFELAEAYPSGPGRHVYETGRKMNNGRNPIHADGQERG